MQKIGCFISKSLDVDPFLDFDREMADFFFHPVIHYLFLNIRIFTYIHVLFFRYDIHRFIHPSIRYDSQLAQRLSLIAALVFTCTQATRKVAAMFILMIMQKKERRGPAQEVVSVQYTSMGNKLQMWQSLVDQSNIMNSYQ